MVHEDVSTAFRFALPETTITKYSCFACLVGASVEAVARGSLGASNLIPENQNAVYLIAV